MNGHPLLAFYSGAYGPTLRIDVRSREDLIAIRNLFRGLASGEVVDADLGKALDCRQDGIHALILRQVRKRPSKDVELALQAADGPTFIWSNTADGWLECAEKVDPLIDDDAPGHQYLAVEGADDVLVELAYLE